MENQPNRLGFFWNKHIAVFAPLVAEGLLVRVGTLLLRLIEIVDSRRLDRAIVEVEFQHVRIGGEDFLHCPRKYDLVKFRQSQYLAGSLPQPIATDVPRVARSLADFFVAVPRLLQTVVSIGFAHTFDKVRSASAADDFRREAVWLYNPMRRRIEVVAVPDFCLHLLKRLAVNDGRMIVCDVVARQLTLVLDDSVRPRIFRNIALQENVPDIDHVLQNIADKEHGAGVPVAL